MEVEVQAVMEVEGGLLLLVVELQAQGGEVAELRQQAELEEPVVVVLELPVLLVVQTLVEMVVPMLVAEEAVAILVEVEDLETMTVQLGEGAGQLLELSKQLDQVQVRETTPIRTMLVVLVRGVVLELPLTVMVAMETQGA